MTFQSRPACLATPAAVVAVTSTPPRFHALRRLSTSTCVIASPLP